MANDSPERPTDDANANDRQAPFSDLAETLRQRRREPDRGEAASLAEHVDPDTEEFFRDESIGPIDPDAVWAAFESESVCIDSPTPEGGPAEYIVPKQTYCEQCHYLSPPPDVSCTHPDTSLLEVVDQDYLRVQNCPIVAQRRALGETDMLGREQDRIPD